MGTPVHFRRCHICGSLNHREVDRVDRCLSCGKALAPFYYFDVRFVPVVGDRNLRPQVLNNEYRPVHGLAVYWEGT